MSDKNNIPRDWLEHLARNGNTDARQVLSLWDFELRDRERRWNETIQRKVNEAARERAIAQAEREAKAKEPKSLEDLA